MYNSRNIHMKLSQSFLITLYFENRTHEGVLQIRKTQIYTPSQQECMSWCDYKPYSCITASLIPLQTRIWIHDIMFPYFKYNNLELFQIRIAVLCKYGYIFTQSKFLEKYTVTSVRSLTCRASLYGQTLKLRERKNTNISTGVNFKLIFLLSYEKQQRNWIVKRTNAIIFSDVFSGRFKNQIKWNLLQAQKLQM